MFLRKIVSTFVCLGLFGVCGVNGMKNVKTIAMKEGTFRCGQSTMSYKIEITPSASSDDIEVLCDMNERGKDSSSSRSELSSLNGKYKINDKSLMNDTKYVNDFCSALKKKLISSKGSIPNYHDVIQLSDKVLDVISRDIKNLQQFKKINIHDIQNISRLIFYKLELDYDFFEHFNKVIIDPLCTIKFTNCTLKDNITFGEILDSCNIQNLSIISCGLTDDDLIEVFLRMTGRNIDNLDLSNNNLTSAVIDRLDDIIYKHGFSIGSMNLSGNSDITNEIAAKIGGFVNDL